jgi:hypothetical protein
LQSRWLNVVSIHPPALVNNKKKTSNLGYRKEGLARLRTSRRQQSHIILRAGPRIANRVWWACAFAKQLNPKQLEIGAQIASFNFTNRLICEGASTMLKTGPTTMPCAKVGKGVARSLLALPAWSGGPMRTSCALRRPRARDAVVNVSFLCLRRSTKGKNSLRVNSISSA